MADSGLDALGNADASTAPAANIDPQSALAALKAATAKLSRPRMEAEQWLALASGFGAPTKSGSFFENLSGANAGLAQSLATQRGQNLENAKLQASMIGMQADLPLKQMQELMLRRQMQGMDLLGSPDGSGVPLTKGGVKAAPGLISQGAAAPPGMQPLSGQGVSPDATPAAQPGAGAANLPEGVPQPAQAYNAAQPPANVAAATANFTKAASSSGIHPLYDVGKMLETGMYYMQVGAKSNLPQASEIGKTMLSQAMEFIKQGALPARMADGSTGVTVMPGYLQKMYGEHLAQNQAKWAGYGAAEKGAERANARDRIEHEARFDVKTTYDAYGNPQQPVSRFDLAAGTVPAVRPAPGAGTGVPGDAIPAPGTTPGTPVPGQAGPSKAPGTLEVNPQLKPVIEAEGKWLGELPTHISMKQQELASIEKMADAYKLVQSGKWAAHKAEISGILKSAGINPSQFNLTDRAQVQIALKEAMKNTLTNFKDVPAGSRFTQAEFMAMKNEGMANPDMEPEANLSILSSMHGIARNDLDFMGHIIKKTETTPGQRVRIADEMNRWYVDKPLKGYVAASREKLGPFKGESTKLDPIEAEIARRAAARQSAPVLGD